MHRRRFRWIVLSLPILLTVVGTTGPATATPGGRNCVSAWGVVSSPNVNPRANALNGVAASSSTDAWAVGWYAVGGNVDRSLTERWDGTSWTVVPTPTVGAAADFLEGVTSGPAQGTWAVGVTRDDWLNNGVINPLILHWDGTAWHRVKSPNAGPASAANDLVSVSAVATDDIWAVGVRGLHTLAMRWDGTSWSVVSSPTPGGIADLAGVVAVSTDDAWAVGGWVDPQANAVRTLVEHWDGTSWTVVESANKGSSDNHLWGIAAAAGRMLAVGDRFSGGGDGPVVPLSLERCAI